MNEIKMKLWHLVLAFIATILTTGALILGALEYGLKVDQYKFEQYKQSYHEWNEDRKQQTDQEPQG